MQVIIQKIYYQAMSSINVRLFNRTIREVPGEALNCSVIDADDFHPQSNKAFLEYKVLKEKIKENNKKDAKFYGNMFEKMTSHPQMGSTGLATSMLLWPTSIVLDMSAQGTYIWKAT